jgi:hypothetical protein
MKHSFEDLTSYTEKTAVESWRKYRLIRLDTGRQGQTRDLCQGSRRLIDAVACDQVRVETNSVKVFARRIRRQR